jgi:hypothetical protein
MRGTDQALKPIGSDLRGELFEYRTVPLKNGWHRESVTGQPIGLIPGIIDAPLIPIVGTLDSHGLPDPIASIRSDRDHLYRVAIAESGIP